MLISVSMFVIVVNIISIDVLGHDGRIRRERVRVVVSRFAESINDLTWLKNYTHTIYSRSEWEDSHGLHIVPLYENVGREGFIYLSHILHHYHKLEPVVVFSQADMAISEEAILKDAVDELIVNITAIDDYGFLYIYPWCMTSYAYNYEYMESLFDRFNLSHIRGNITLSKERQFDLEFLNLAWQLYGIKIDHDPTFTPTGTIAVKRDLIHQHPISYYARLARLIGNESRAALGYFYERTWSYLFNSTCSSVKRCLTLGGCR